MALNELARLRRIRAAVVEYLKHGPQSLRDGWEKARAELLEALADDAEAWRQP